MNSQLNQATKIRLSALRMHSASSVKIPILITNFTSLQLYVQLKPLKLNATSAFDVPSQYINTNFNNGPKSVLLPF